MLVALDSDHGIFSSTWRQPVPDLATLLSSSGELTGVNQISEV